VAERTARWRWRLLLAAGSLLVALLLAEAGLRLFAPGLHDTATLAAQPAEDKLGRYRRRSADDELYYELKPDLDITFGASRVRTDNRGVRLPATPAPPPTAEPVDLVVLGDSTSFGWRVDWEQSYPARVAARLEQAWRRPVRLTNRSVPGYNSEQELRQLRLAVLPDPPDLLLWHVDHNDANAVLESNQPVVLRPEDGDNVLHSSLLKALLRALRSGNLDERLHEQQPHERMGGYLTGGPLWERHVTALEQAAHETRMARVPTLFVLIDCNVWFGQPSQEHVRCLHDPLRARLRAAGADVLDLYPSLQGAAHQRGLKDLSSLWLAVDDPHPGPEVHALLAELISAAFHVRWPAPPEPP